MVIPVVTVLLSAVLLKEKLLHIQKAGVFLSLVAAVWVVMDGNVFQLVTMSWNAGDGIMIGAIGCWAIYSITVKEYMHLFPQNAVLLVMSSISIIVLLPFIVGEWIVTGVPSSLMTPMNLNSLAYLGIFPSFIALICYNRAVRILGASQASVFLNFLPIVTMIGAYFWLGETITIMKIIGAVAVICGVILTTKGK
ncbi:DMT family transporter [Virgibacillus sp. L01]|uniref:DMT family transporter n=1 Tax=Virgibacillus sp. L01 TaxID=3457429 RepID=UPI003FD34EBE